jgi:4-amino-4-deoxy-L-arabinose transferase-like glycosyltransferase
LNRPRWLVPTALVILAAHASYAWRALSVIHRVGSFGGSPSYGQIASNLLHRHVYTWMGNHMTAYRPPLYPLFLAATMSVAGGEWLRAATLVQGALALVACALVMRVVWRIFGDPLATVLAGLLFALDLPLYEEVLSQTEVTLFLLIEVAFFWALARPRLSRGWLAALAALAGLAHLAHPTGTLLLPLVIASAIWAPRPAERRSVARTALAVAVPFLLLALPWQLAIYRGFRVVTLASSSTSGSNLYKGNNPDFFTLFPYVWLDDYEPWMQRLLRQHGVTGDEFARDRFLRHQAFDYIRAEPGAFLRRAGAKVAALYSPRPTPLGKADLVDRDGRVALANYRASHSLLRDVKAIHWCVVLAGALLFLAGLGLRPAPFAKPALWTGAAFVVAMTLIHAVVTSGTRYRLPMDPPLVAIAAAGWAGLLRRFTSRRGT